MNKLYYFCLSCLLTFFAILTGCGGGTSSDTTATPASYVIPLISTTCGFSPCIASATTTANGNLLKDVVPLVWMALGFPDSNTYTTSIAVTADRAIVPAGGWIGRLNLLRTNLISAITAQMPSVTSCALTPASGTITIPNINGGGTLTFAPSTLTGPTAWPKTATYDHHFSFSGMTDTNLNTVSGTFDFYCDWAAGTYTIKTTNSLGVVLHRMLVYFDTQSSAARFIDLYEWDKGALTFTGTSQEEASMGFQWRTLAQSKFRVALTYGKVDATGLLVAAKRLVAEGDPTSKKTAVVYYDRSAVSGGDNGTSVSSLTPLAYYTSTSATSAQALSAGVGSTTSYPAGGCISDWSALYTAVTTTDLSTCESMVPVTPDLPPYNPSANFSLGYFLGSLKLDLETLIP